MSHEAAFRQAITESPDDDTPRLIYADWLEDHGQPDAPSSSACRSSWPRAGRDHGGERS